MSNPRKQQGTANETRLVDMFNAHPRVKAAWRLAEGGSNDPGDIAVETIDGDVYVVEAKHRERLPVHRTLKAVLDKIEKADLPFVPAGGALQWKRSVLKDGNDVRSADGMSEVMVIPVDEWLDLITR